MTPAAFVDFIRGEKGRAYIACCVIICAQFATNTVPCSFLAVWAAENGLHELTTGLTLSSYPLGMSVTGPFVPALIWNIGTRSTSLLGLGLMATTFACFGLVPDAPASSGGTTGLLCLTQFFTGAFSALPGTTAYILINAHFKDGRIAAAMSGATLALYVGAAAGNYIGSLFYELQSDQAWQFRLPALAMSGLLMLVALALPCLIRNEHLGRENLSGETRVKKKVEWKQAFEEAASRTLASARHGLEAWSACSICPQWMTLSIFLALCSAMMMPAIVGFLDSSLSLRLSSVPFVFCYTQIATVSFVSLMTSAFTNLLMAPIAERLKQSSRYCKLVTALGFFCIGLGYIIIAPFSPAALGGASSATIVPPDSTGAFYAGKLTQGVGNALSGACVFPDMMLNVEDDVYLEARITSAYSSMFALGWAIGPLLGSALYSLFASVDLCLEADAVPPNCPASDRSPCSEFAEEAEGEYVYEQALENTLNVTTLDPIDEQGWDGILEPYEAEWCKCEWQPQNGFDGMATVGGLVMICYALVLLVAAGFNVGAKKVRHNLARATVNRRSCAAKVPAQKVGRITMYDVRLTQAQDRATRASSVVVDPDEVASSTDDKVDVCPDS